MFKIGKAAQKVLNDLKNDELWREYHYQTLETRNYTLSNLGVGDLLTLELPKLCIDFSDFPLTFWERLNIYFAARPVLLRLVKRREAKTKSRLESKIMNET